MIIPSYYLFSSIALDDKINNRKMMRRFIPRFLHNLSLFLASMALVCCSSGSGDNDNSGTNNNDGGTVTDTAQLVLHLLPSSSTYNRVIPRMVASYKGWNVIETSNPAATGLLTLQFLNGPKNEGYMVTVTDSTVMFTRYNVLSGTMPSTVVVAAKGKSGDRLMTCNVDWSAKTVEMTGSMSLDDHSVASPIKRRASTDINDTRRILYDMFDDIGDKISDMGTVTGYISQSVASICEVWSSVIIPIAQYQLYSDDPEMLATITNKQLVSNGQSLVVSMMPDKAQEIYEHYQQALLAYKYGLSSYTSSYEFNETQIDNMLSSLSLSSLLSQEVQSEAGSEAQEDYTLQVSVSNITKTSATLSGSYTGGGQAAITDMGFRYHMAGGLDITLPSSGLGAITLNELEEGTAYFVYAYLVAGGVEYRSAVKDFTTDSDFGVSPSSLIFENAGGTKAVYVASNIHTLSWTITSKPSWCNIERAANSFFVDVEQSTEQRSGEILITATMDDGTTLEATVAVAQYGPEGEGTNYYYMGSSDASSISHYTYRSDGSVYEDKNEQHYDNSHAIVWHVNGAYYLYSFNSYTLHLGGLKVGASFPQINGITNATLQSSINGGVIYFTGGFTQTSSNASITFAISIDLNGGIDFTSTIYQESDVTSAYGYVKVQESGHMNAVSEDVYNADNGNDDSDEE